MLGVAAAMSREGKPMAARQFGEYAQSSGSNNAVLLMADKSTLDNVERHTVPVKEPVGQQAGKLAQLEETE
jgi:hypothetical protein